MRRDWPLVGRGDELGHLSALLTAERSQGAILAGPAGVGKTRLALECLDLAERSGLATLRVTATRAATGLPLGALAPFLPGGQQGEKAVDDRIDLLRRSAGALLERAGARRLFLFVDDAHLLDDISALLVHHLAVTDSAFVLVTLRTGESAPDPVMALWKDDLVDRIEVRGLTAAAVEELLEAVLDGPVDHAAVYQFAGRSEGNVLFLRELVLGAMGDGSLRKDGGIWRLVGRFCPSDRLVELVENRLGGLAEAERALVEMVSTGEPLGRGELDGFDPGIAEQVERKGLITVRMDGRRLQVEFAHPLYGDVLRARIPLLRGQALARSLAEIVEDHGARRREDTLRVATWRLDGGDARPDLTLAAATIARWRYDFSLAERLARAALQAGAGFDAALLAAQLLVLQGRCREAETELVTVAAQAGDDAQRGQVAITRIENLAFYLGRPDEGLAVAADAERAIADPQWRDEIAARRSAILIGTEGPRAGAEAAEALLARSGGRALIWASHSGAYALGRLGRFQAAIDATVTGYAAHLALTQPLDWYPWLHIVFRCEALAHAGRFHDAEALALERYQQGLSSHSIEEQAWFAWQLEKTVGSRGHVRSAVGYGREAVALFRQLGRPQMEHWCLTYLALAFALAGEPDEAAEAIAAMDALALPTTFYMGVDELQSRAWTLVAAGDVPRARGLLEEAAERGERIGDLVGAAAALHSLARLGQARRADQRLARLAARIEGDLASAYAAHCHGLSCSDAPALESVSVAFEAMGADLLAAEALTDAAVAWRRAGEPRHAAAAERRAHELAPRCQGAVTPALHAVGTRAALTPAERETAALAAAGHANKEIAGKLGVSVRTVESRLLHVYQKLGIAGRAGLTAAFTESPAARHARSRPPS